MSKDYWEEKNAAQDEASRLRVALREIADMHPGDQPASSALTEEQWLRKCIVEMRVIASNAIAAKP